MYFVTWFKDTLVSMMCGFEFNAISLLGMMCNLFRNLLHFRLHSSGWKSSVRLEPRTQFLFKSVSVDLSLKKSKRQDNCIVHKDDEQMKAAKLIAETQDIKEIKFFNR